MSHQTIIDDIRDGLLQRKLPNQLCQIALNEIGFSRSKDAASIPSGPPHHVTIFMKNMQY